MRRRHLSRAEIAAALRHYESLRVDGEPPGHGRGAASECKPETTPETTGDAAQVITLSPHDKMRRAKLAFTLACADALAGTPDAEARCADALLLIEEARAELARLAEDAPC